ncbi:MAG: hypothetical protein KBT29_11245 [Prevotellaceae bacterium]|nr:hypothetical protein [Candidatus Minthosoma caballi]
MRNIFKNFKLTFDRSFSRGLFPQLVWLLSIMVIAYLLLIGLSYFDAFYSPGSEESRGRWFDVLFLLFDPGSINDSLKSPFVTIIALCGMTIFCGMLISVISNVLERRVDRYNNGDIEYDISNHVVVLGFNKSVPSLLKSLSAKYKDSFIVLMCNESSDVVREWIHANLDSQKDRNKHLEDNLIVMKGLRNADDDLDRLCLGRGVREIYVLGEENEHAHDAVNMECVRKIVSKLPGTERDGKKVRCFLQLESHIMFSVLQITEVSKDIKDKIEFLPYSFNEIWAQNVLSTVPNEKYNYRSLDGDGITADSAKHVHLVIAGMNDMGLSIAVNAAHLLHFPNFKDGDFKTCSHITFVDKDAEYKGKSFRRRYAELFRLSRWRSAEDAASVNSVEWIDPMAAADAPTHLGKRNFMDIQWEFISANIIDDEVLNYLSDCVKDKDEVLSIVMCGEDADANAVACLALPVDVRCGANQIFVRQNENAEMIDQLATRFSYECIRPFGMMTECYKENLMSDRFGKLINACYNEINITDVLSVNEANKRIDDAWNECSITDKWSSIYCANMLYYKLRSLGLKTDTLTEEQIEEKLKLESVQKSIQRTEHNRWNTEKLFLGFVPLTEDEQKEFEPLKDDKPALKERKKKFSRSYFKHLDICSNDRLFEVDKFVANYDNKVNSKLWALFRLSKT